jgi:5-formyltetrahydrofolate cyclo-ligase
MKVQLSLIDKQSFTEWSSLIAKNLQILLSSQNIIQDKLIIGAFAPIYQEPIWFQGISPEVLKLIAFPTTEKGTLNMIFKLSQLSDLVIKKDFGFNILGPKDISLTVNPEVMLIPGLSFTRIGERLGRGKGHYDQFLEKYLGLKIGICFSLQIEKEIPTEMHDVQLDYIVTEKEIINCKLA